jgi:hypothetical protein
MASTQRNYAEPERLLVSWVEMQEMQAWPRSLLSPKRCDEPLSN